MPESGQQVGQDPSPSSSVPGLCCQLCRVNPQVPEAPSVLTSLVRASVLWPFLVSPVTAHGLLTYPPESLAGREPESPAGLLDQRGPDGGRPGSDSGTRSRQRAWSWGVSLGLTFREAPPPHRSPPSAGPGPCGGERRLPSWAGGAPVRAASRGVRRSTAGLLPVLAGVGGVCVRACISWQGPP